ncbi:MAG: bifunctional [glutamine synthetase] adenylyltransferase/[glutamine synthetase]-adenylyl-L-tyrosine phosphorylase, partial [Alphaproteobacteria bacterium]|nr:bifunctional [glutamine synthetase] adenylyltransferase/[glutamine synthetase]-adenylyl-L-tyrosine phosphorylase [Alphaproteobacteria bacterium]
MAIKLNALPKIATPRLNAWLTELAHEQQAALKSALPTLGPLLEVAPYLLALAQANLGWLLEILGDSADGAFIDIIEAVDAAGRVAVDEAELAPVLRIAKGRTALLAALSETGGAWTTAQATAALSDLADAALNAALNLLLREAANKGLLTLPPGQATAANSGLAIFALGKHGGQELNYSSDIDIVAFYDPDKGVLNDPSEATKIYSRIVQKLVGLMEERQAFGYVFRTDLRLRPDPGSTPVAI